VIDSKKQIFVDPRLAAACDPKQPPLMGTAPRMADREHVVVSSLVRKTSHMIFQPFLGTLCVARKLRVAWLRRFGDPAVRAVFATLDAEALLDPHWNLIKDQVEESIAHYAKMIDELRDERSDFNPRLVVYSLGETACSSCLGSGRHHFYRGALTHEGMVIESLTRHILRVLYELGAYTQEAYEMSLEGMSDLIKGSG
jgi:hypothetical protein